MTVLVIGSGIGGLTAALSLHQAGVPVRVFDRVSEFKPLGVGINILPHAARELIELGLLDKLDETGVRISELGFFSKHGKPIWSEPRGIAAGYKWPQISIHRGELHRLLLDATIERIGAENVLIDHNFAGWTASGKEVRARFIDSKGRPVGEYCGSLLVGADGIHSAVRESLYPNEGPPVWCGEILWRGVTEGSSFLDGYTMAVAGHRAVKLICYPIDRAASQRGRPLINWIAECTMPPTYQWLREDYDRTGKLEEFLPKFADWSFDWLDIPRIFRDASCCFEYPMVDRNPLPRWSFDRVTLLGDAAHPVSPAGSNGASQAILDARVLAREILLKGETEAALEAYEAERRPTTTQLLFVNRNKGPGEIMELVEERAPNGYDVVTDVISQHELEEVAESYKRVAGFQVAALNAKPSVLSVAPFKGMG